MRHIRQHRSCVQEYADELAEGALKCGDVFDDNELMGFLVEDLKDEIRRSVQHHWYTHR